MKIRINWKAILPVAKLFLAQTSPAALKVEEEAEDIFSKEGRTLPSQEKSDRWVKLAIDGVHASEDVAHKDLLNDPEIARLARGVGDAVVAFKNGLAVKAASAPAAAGPAAQ